MAPYISFLTFLRWTFIAFFFTILLLHINKRMRKPVDPFDLWKNASFVESKEEKVVPSIFRAEIFSFFFFFSSYLRLSCQKSANANAGPFKFLRLGECSKFKKFYRKKVKTLRIFVSYFNTDLYLGFPEKMPYYVRDESSTFSTVYTTFRKPHFY